MLTEKIRAALVEKMRGEQRSALLYFSMAYEFGSYGLPGFEHWMLLQFDEELQHMIRFYEYLRDRDAKIEFKAAEPPAKKFSSPEEAIEFALAQEKETTARIHEIMDMAREAKDYETELFLNWFILEQMEEEKTLSRVLRSIQMVKGSAEGLARIDRGLGMRQSPCSCNPKR